MSDDRPPTFGSTRSILGVPARITSNARAVIELADSVFAAWPRTRARPVVRLRLDVGTCVPRGAQAHALPTRDRLVIRGGGAHVRVDAIRGRARGRIDRELLDDPQHARQSVLEAALLFMLTMRDRVPFHAAAIARGDAAILCAGPSGAGKSTLALAALRAGTGWRVLSEDCVYIETRARTRVWGWPGFVHVAPDTSRFFPDLAHLPAPVLASGKRKVSVAVPIDARPWARRVALCILHRTEHGPSLERADRTAALRTLTGDLEPGFDRFGGTLADALDKVVGARVWRFDAGPDPRRSMRLLEDLPIDESRTHLG